MAYLSGYTKRIKITSQNAKVASAYSYAMIYDCSQLSAAKYNSFWTDIKAGGVDIRVTKADGTTEVARGVREFDAGEKEGLIYFNADGISTSADVDFYIYYGKSDASDYADDHATLGMQKVFSTNYKFYSTMADLTTSTVKDETSEGNDGTKTAANEPNEVNGLIGNAQDFDGEGDEINLGFNINESNPFSYMCFYSTESTEFETAIGAYWHGANRPLRIGQRGTEKAEFVYRDGSDIRATGGPKTSTGAWFHVVGVWDGTDLKLYVNGNLEDTVSEPTAPTSLDRDNYLGSLNGVHFGEIKLDEVGMLTEALTANEILTIYNNQSDNSSFWATSDIEEADVGLSINISDQLNITESVDVDIQAIPAEDLNVDLSVKNLKTVKIYG